MDIRRWLEGHNLGQYADLFEQHEIDLETLAELDEDDLEKIGVASLGHRKKIVREVGRDPTPSVAAENSSFKEEIELRDYLEVVWRFRKVFFLSAALFFLIFWSYKGVLFFRDRPTISYYSSLITLSFPGYERGLYPNGSNFSIADIIASKVLRKVYHQKNLDQYEIPLNQFVKAFKVSFVSLEKDFIVQSYAQKAAAVSDKLNLVELETLQQQLRDELARSSRSQVLIQFEKNNNWQLRENQIYDLLESIPVVWQEISVREKGVFTPNVARYGAENLFSYQVIFSSNEPLVGLEILKKNIVYFKNYLEDMGEIPNIQNYSLKDINGPIEVVLPDEDLTLNDIKKTLTEVESFTIPRLLFSHTELGIFSDSSQVVMFYDSQIFELVKQKDLLQSKILALEEVIESYTELSGRDLKNTKITGEQSAGSTIPQFDDSFLSAIIDLAGKSDDLTFKKSLMLELKDYKLKLSQVSNDIGHLNNLKGRISRTKDKRSTHKIGEALREETKTVVERLAHLVTATLKLEEMAGAQNFLDQSMFTSLGYSKKETLLPEVISGYNIKIFVIGLLVLMMIETLGVFLISYIRNRG